MTAKAKNAVKRDSRQRAAGRTKVQSTKVVLESLCTPTLFKDDLGEETTLIVNLREAIEATKDISAEGNPRPGYHNSMIRKRIRETASKFPEEAPMRALNRGMVIHCDGFTIKGKKIELVNPCLFDGNTTRTSILSMDSEAINAKQTIRIVVRSLKNPDHIMKSAVGLNTGKGLSHETKANAEGMYETMKILCAKHEERISWHEADSREGNGSFTGMMKAGEVIQLLSIAHPKLSRRDMGDENRKIHPVRFYSGKGATLRALEEHPEVWEKEYTSDMVAEILELSDEIQVVFQPGSRVKESNPIFRLYRNRIRSELPFLNDDQQHYELHKGFQFLMFWAVVSKHVVVGDDGIVTWVSSKEDALDDLRKKRDLFIKKLSAEQGDAYAKKTASWDLAAGWLA